MHEHHHTSPPTATDRVQVHDRTFRPYISANEIHQMVRRMAQDINRAYAGSEITMLVVLHGAMVFASDLMRHLTIPVAVETMKASSYRDAMQSSGVVGLEDVVPDVRGRHLLIVEDIVDTGRTMRELVKHLGIQEPLSVGLATLLSKPDVHKGMVDIDFLGRDIGPDFVVGYGMDYAGYGRHLDAIWVVDDET